MPRGNPHKFGWFFDLAKLFKLDSRPVSQWLDDMDDGGLPKPDESLADLLRLGTDRRKRSQIFEEMDAFGLVQAILDVYAEEATQPDYDKKKRVWIESKAKHMIAAGEDALHNLQMEEKITPITRRTAKYGDAWQRFIYATGKGVLGWRTAKSAQMMRIEDKFGRLIGFKQQGMKYRQKSREVSWPWDYVHFRLLGRDEEDLYGTSILEAMFRPWRQMMLTEDSMLMFRLRRTPDRNMVFVDTGNLEPHEAMDHVNTWRKRFRKHEFLDPASSQYRKQYNPLTPLEDIFVPWREGQNTRVETLSGAGNVGEIYDLEFFRDAFFGTAKVPKAYFGFEGDINAKATLAQQDVRFARTVKRIQHSSVLGVRTALDIHYTLLANANADSKERYDFLRTENAYTVQMSPISFLDEFERLELMQLRYQVVQALGAIAGDLQIDARVWAIYILLNFAKLPEDLVLKLIKKVPDQVPPTGGGEGFEQQEPEAQEQILDPKGQQALGAYDLTEKEALMCARAIHESPGLRKSIGVWAEYGNDCVMDSTIQQIDSSLLPPRVEGKVLEDDYTGDHDGEAKELQEDLKTITDPKSEDDASEDPQVLVETGSEVT